MMAASGPMSETPGGQALSEEDACIPLRMVESASYCPRQAWYRFVACDDPINADMQRGLNRHEVFGEQELHPPEGEQVWRHLAVYAPRLGVSGVLDEVSVTAERLMITEYKTTRRSAAIWEGVLMQLAAQHLALREHAVAGAGRWQGAPLPAETLLRVYYTDSKRTREAAWSSALEQRARAVIALCQAIVHMPLPPAGNVGPRCAACQHEPICLPFDLPKIQGAAR